MVNHNKRGMPEGHLVYPKEIVLNRLSNEFKTTNDILNDINSEESIRNLSWNTIQKYLKMLSQEGLVEMRRIGHYNLWRLSLDKKNEINNRVKRKV